jgi:hypothetical protein
VEEWGERRLFTKRCKFFILGYYGFGNWGDELSLRAVLGDLEQISEKLQLPFLYQVLYRGNDFLLPPPVKFIR